MNNLSPQDRISIDNQKQPFCERINKAYTLRVVCQECGFIYKTKPCSAEMDGKESHGLCSVCYPMVKARWMKEIE